MKRLLRHGLLLLLTPLYLGHGISACHYAALSPAAEQEREGGERAYLELAGMPGETVMGSGVCMTLHVEPFFRHPPKDFLPMLGQEHERALVPRYHSARCSFFHAIALRQGAGYYVFSLREIIV
ncbi:MAG: hypothetical protein LBD64_07665 [Odoribacteraceae bacterium]|jgi:hypothetical protein|nr:hypothetical protein [Odoribacteraceae bacterium]